jgi:hypothetical protein
MKHCALPRRLELHTTADTMDGSWLAFGPLLFAFGASPLRRPQVGPRCSVLTVMVARQHGSEVALDVVAPVEIAVVDVVAVGDRAVRSGPYVSVQ